MCYGTNCGREGAFGTCYHPEDCIMRAIERDAEENLAARLARDTALSREHFPCPNCLEQGERHSLTYENGLFTCPECGGECDAAELIALYDDIRAGHVSDAEVVGLWIEKLDARRVACLTTSEHGSREKAAASWNALPRALTWTRDPQLGAWNWWRDEYSCIPRYVYQDGTVAITMLIARVPYQYLGGQWAGPIPEPVEPKD